MKSLKLYAALMLLFLAIGGTSQALVEYVYKDLATTPATWKRVRVSDTLAIKSFAANNGCNNETATQASHHGGAFGITHPDGKLVYIAGNPTAGFTVTNIADGPFADVDCLAPDVFATAGPGGADLFYYDTTSSNWVTSTVMHATVGTGNLKVVARTTAQGAYVNYAPVYVDSANAVWYSWLTLALNNKKGVRFAGWESVLPTSTTQVVEAFAAYPYTNHVLYGDGSYKYQERGGGVWSTVAPAYTIGTTEGLKLMLRPGNVGAQSIYALTTNAFVMEAMSWTHSPRAVIQLVDLTGKSYVAGVNSTLVHVPGTLQPDIFFFSRDSGELERFADTATGWKRTKIFLDAHYKWLGQAGALDTFYGSYDTVPVELSSFEAE